MEIVEKEEFCFDILNQLIDTFDLHIDDYTKLVNQIWNANTHEEIDGILTFLQNNLLNCIKGSVQ